LHIKELVYNNNMNIQEYLANPETVMATTVVGSLVIAYAGFTLGKWTSRKCVLDEEEDTPEDRVVIRVGKTYYRRIFDTVSAAPIPWPDKDSAVKVLVRRHDWVKFVELVGENKDEESFMDVCSFNDHFMEDEFGDFVKPKYESLVVAPTPEPKVTIDSLDAEVGFIPEIPVKSTKNVIQIDGKDYVLSPVEPSDIKQEQ